MRSLLRLLPLAVVLPLAGCYWMVPGATPLYYSSPPPPPPPAVGDRRAPSPPPPPAVGDRRAPSPPPPPAVGGRRAMTYNEAVGLGSSYCQSRGYSCVLQEAHETGNGVWMVKFKTWRGDGKGQLHLNYDTWSRSLLRADDNFHEHGHGNGHGRGHGHGHEEDDD